MARLSLRLSKCHIVGNHVSRLNYNFLGTLDRGPDMSDLGKRDKTRSLSSIFAMILINLVVSSIISFDIKITGMKKYVFSGYTLRMINF